ncbi:Hypothetical predicted protein [Paramuricea clavata]|uniref:Uncharacterized protein n=1 Tax=Paramuricea clavata TaxID=317549 RepID=A0A6S7FR53_PARCT|nr:Hypothetical predicted protein [Paramuricea clavata]
MTYLYPQQNERMYGIDPPRLVMSCNALNSSWLETSSPSFLETNFEMSIGDVNKRYCEFICSSRGEVQVLKSKGRFFSVLLILINIDIFTLKHLGMYIEGHSWAPV